MKPYIESLPDSVRIGPFNMRLEKWDTHVANGTGEFSPTAHLIKIDEDIVTPTAAVDTLLHQIEYAIEWAYFVRDGDNAERRATLLARGWTQVFRDNRWLLYWIDNTLHGPKWEAVSLTSKSV